MKTRVRLFLMLVAILVSSAFVFAQESDNVPVEIGDTILLQGQLTDTKGNPIADAVIELWSADINGNYNHPNDAAASELVSDFQYFGTATTDENGYYAFLTIKPSPYENRPTHLHFKVKISDETVLTSQFYFEEDRADVEQDGAFANAGDTLFLQTAEGLDADDNTLLISTGNIVLDINGSEANTQEPTANQTEGPYYPVVDFSAYDNNLNSVAEDDEPVTPILEDSASTEFTLFNLNTATDGEFLTLPNMDERIVREFEEHRPYTSILQFRLEIGKYVDDSQLAEWEEYVYVPIDVNAADAATLMQLEGVTEEIANQLIAARPFVDNDAFLTMLGSLVPAVNTDYAANYLGD
jgi:DNA uptake protein ComE-like DNA-binding protein